MSQLPVIFTSVGFAALTLCRNHGSCASVDLGPSSAVRWQWCLHSWGLGCLDFMVKVSLQEGSWVPENRKPACHLHSLRVPWLGLTLLDAFPFLGRLWRFFCIWRCLGEVWGLLCFVFPEVGGRMPAFIVSLGPLTRMRLSSGSCFPVSCNSVSLSVEDCCWTPKDAGILGLRRRRIQSRARDKAWSLRAFG